ncbi:alpha/beta fold hydrolase [Neotabrizicola sp. sgz301269]|uniref:alpha/beta fold hydrolase n=1 Tax=Neotabrizicola sp. sgz301269 TaxID=3276282 RepID=UPI00376FF7B6
MADVLLIHGAGHGAWCWHRLIPALADLGHTARAIDLPGRGGTTTTLDAQAQAILTALTGPTILVAHSAAGYPASRAANLDDSKIRAVIHLAAWLPQAGRSLADLRRAWPDNPLGPALRLSPDRLSYSFDPAGVEALFYHDCPPEDRVLAARHLCAEPRAPHETPYPPGKSTRPQFYIRCSEDHAIPPAQQAEMAAALPPENRFDLPASHSPFFSRPENLARLIDRIARTIV